MKPFDILVDDYVYILSRLDDCQTAEEEEAILAELEAVSDDVSTKAENYARIIRNMLAEIAGYETEIKRMQARKKSKENAVERLKGYILYCMNLVGATELRTSIGKWKIQKNPISIAILDESKIPEEFTVPQPPKVIKSAIAQHFKQTGEIPDGCEIVQSEGVRFR